MSERLVLVTGATGQQGGAVARGLMARGIGVRGMTRNADSETARALSRSGAEVVTADFTDADSMAAALDGVDTLFAMTTPFEAGVEAETAQGIALIDAAKEAGVDYVVFSSVAGADLDTGIPHFESKWEVEKHLTASGVRWAVIGPVYFMENLFFPDALAGLRNGAYAIPMPADVPLQQIALEDIGAFGARVCADRDDFAGRRIDIAGDELTSAEVASVLGQKLGREIAHVQVPIDQIRSWSEDLAIMYEWFHEHGYSVDIEGLRTSYPDVGWQRFAEWADRVPAALG